MINKGVLHTVATRFPRNNAITCQWGWGEWANTTMIAFTGVTRLNSCVRTHCFHLFDICRVEFIWGNITFLSYIDGSVQERCTVLLIKVLPSLPVTAQRGSAPSAPYPPERATSGIATCSAVGDTYSHLAGSWNQGIIAHQTPHFRRPPKHVNNKGPSVFAETSSKCTFRTKSFKSIWKNISFGIYV